MIPPQTNQAPKTKSALLPFPRELRDYIYEYLLTDTFSVKTLRTGKPSLSLPLRPHSHLAILNVSRSTYEEAKRVLYKHARFRFDAASAYSPRLREEIRKFPAIEMLQDITIYLDIRVEMSRGYPVVGWGRRFSRHSKCARLLRPFFGEEVSNQSATHRSRGWDDKAQLVESATTLINYFAGLDSIVPRKRCVVETVFISTMDLLYSSTRELVQLRDAICRLTGFRVVELKMWDSQDNLGLAGFLIRRFACLGEVLVTRLGNEEQVCGQEYVRCIFYPHREQSRAAPRRRDISL